MAESEDKVRLLPLVIVWLVIAAIGAGVYKFVIAEDEQKIIDGVGITELYDHQVRIGHDTFSGYAILRSPELKDRLDKARIGLLFENDGADYAQRIKALNEGELDMAVFTVGALIKASAELGEYPATIVLVLDESRGADAMVASKSTLPNAQALEKPGAKIVLTPDSPSETLARILFAHFSFQDSLSDRAEHADGAKAVYERLVADGKDSQNAYVLWEPYVAKALEDPGLHVLLDSAQLRGYIVDVLVASRRFLKDREAVAKQVVEDYLRVAYKTAEKAGGLEEMVVADAKAQGDPLSPSQAKRLVEGVHWKTTLENYAHFGIVAPERRKGLSNLQEMIRKIVAVQVKTGALRENPIDGQENRLFYDGILRALHDAEFHPGHELNIIEGEQASLQEIVGDAELTELSESDWEQLVVMGSLRVDPLSFGRGSAKLHQRSERQLKELAERLKDWPQVYLQVVGHARQEGDPEANRVLAQQRAEAALAKLHELGVSPKRTRAMTATPRGTGGDAQSVSFVVGQRAY